MLKLKFNYHSKCVENTNFHYFKISLKWHLVVYFLYTFSKPITYFIKKCWLFDYSPWYIDYAPYNVLLFINWVDYFPQCIPHLCTLLHISAIPRIILCTLLRTTAIPRIILCTLLRTTAIPRIILSTLLITLYFTY